MGIDINEIATLIDGYYCIINPQNHFVEEVLQYSPFTGEELPGGFLWELNLEVSCNLRKRDKDKLLYKKWQAHLKDNSPIFDINLIPSNLKFLVNTRKWFDIRKERDKTQHQNGEFCGGLSGVVDGFYGYKELPKLACVPIQYCPFCGVKLPLEFDQENWWEKEFKTFKWYKDHKLGEWADDYVDDCDWTEDDYPPVDQN